MRRYLGAQPGPIYAPTNDEPSALEILDRVSRSWGGCGAAENVRHPHLRRKRQHGRILP